MKCERRQDAERSAATLLSRHNHAVRIGTGARINRKDRDTAEAVAEPGEQLFQPIGTQDDNEAAPDDKPCHAAIIGDRTGVDQEKRRRARVSLTLLSRWRLRPLQRVTARDYTRRLLSSGT